eukprot:TRINITY_DN57_c0_g2_i2.p1 TRINITY_DN57_c0_g2~~TRINITY_DN57_c0_g2_i2.p1  ORF type:complete len:214 (-),score=25.76 TRINITY_DN57_c0_g2_i2:2301-2942(-)
MSPRSQLKLLASARVYTSDQNNSEPPNNSKQHQQASNTPNTMSAANHSFDGFFFLCTMSIATLSLGKYVDTQAQQRRPASPFTAFQKLCSAGVPLGQRGVYQTTQRPRQPHENKQTLTMCSLHGVTIEPAHISKNEHAEQAQRAHSNKSRRRRGRRGGRGRAKRGGSARVEGAREEHSVGERHHAEAGRGKGGRARHARGGGRGRRAQPSTHN